jgi:hypothetical protein
LGFLSAQISTFLGQIEIFDKLLDWVEIFNFVLQNIRIFKIIMRNKLKLLIYSGFYLFFIFIGYIVIGAFTGAIIASIAAGIIVVISGEDSGIAISIGFSLGLIVGAIACALAFPFIHNIPFYKVYHNLVIYTCIPLFLLAIIPKYGILLSMYGSVIGFILGVLKSRKINNKCGQQSIVGSFDGLERGDNEFHV